MKYRVFLSAFFIFLPLLTQAEYRVFVLKITKRTATPRLQQQTQRPRTFVWLKATLDPEQYRYYYPVSPDEDVTYIDTWRCYGRTGDFAPLCPNPKAQIPPAEAPALNVVVSF